MLSYPLDDEGAVRTHNTRSGLGREIWLGAALLLGCGPTLGVRQRLVNDAQSRIQQNFASLQHGGVGFDLAECSHRATVTQLAANAFEVRLCGVIVEYTRDDSDRFRFQPMRPAASLATVALRCPLSELESVQSDTTPVVRVIRGCGRSATYRLHCRPEFGCVWFAPSVESIALTPPPPPPPTTTTTLDPLVVPASTRAPQPTEAPQLRAPVTTPSSLPTSGDN
jgi:hypothetical protein